MPPRAAKRARLASPAAATTVEVTCPAPADLSASRSDAVRRLYEAGELCDGEVVHGDRTYKVSRMMLGAASQFFRAYELRVLYEEHQVPDQVLFVVKIYFVFL